MPDLPEPPAVQSDAIPASAVRPPPGQRQTVLWIIALLLTVIATALIVRRDDTSFLAAAMGQASGSPRANLDGGRGIYAFTGQVSARSYGLFMLDVDTGTVWCYELQRSGTTGEPRLNLLAARSWVFDRYLEDFNTGEPIPSVVRAMVQQQRSNRAPASQPGAGAGPN